MSAAMSDPGMSRPLSVWVTAQRDARAQRAGRYVPETTRHPARMLPAIARQAIEALTEPGDLVFDPMCGAGTTLVEALHTGRHAAGIDIEPAWAELARANIAHTHRLGVGGHAHVITTDSRLLPGILPPDYLEQMLGRVRLVLTSPPYGNNAHGLVRSGPGGVVKRHYRYAPHARSANLAFQPPTRLLAGVARILAGCRALLAPDAHIVITTRPWREGSQLVDLPGAVARAAADAGLVPVQRCAALLAGIREHRLVVRASFFQRRNVTLARQHGQPWHLICHEDVLICKVPEKSVGSPAQAALAAPRAPAPGAAGWPRHARGVQHALGAVVAAGPDATTHSFDDGLDEFASGPTPSIGTPRIG